MKWILFYLTSSDNVAYVTEENQTISYLPYYSFLAADFVLRVDDYSEMLEKINCFETILINFETHKWEIYKQEEKPPTFEELSKLNTTEKKEEEISLVEKANKFINNFVRNTQTKKGVRLDSKFNNFNSSLHRKKF